MNYIQLLKHIESLPPERQQDTVTVAVHFNGDCEWYPVTLKPARPFLSLPYTKYSSKDKLQVKVNC